MPVFKGRPRKKKRREFMLLKQKKQKKLLKELKKWKLSAKSNQTAKRKYTKRASNKENAVQDGTPTAATTSASSATSAASRILEKYKKTQHQRAAESNATKKARQEKGVAATTKEGGGTTGKKVNGDEGKGKAVGDGVQQNGMKTNGATHPATTTTSTKIKKEEHDEEKGEDGKPIVHETTLECDEVLVKMENAPLSPPVYMSPVKTEEYGMNPAYDIMSRQLDSEKVSGLD